MRSRTWLLALAAVGALSLVALAVPGLATAIATGVKVVVFVAAMLVFALVVLYVFLSPYVRRAQRIVEGRFFRDR